MPVHTATGVRCGNRAQHGADVVHHATVAEVRDCFAESGRFQVRSVVPVQTVGVRPIQRPVVSGVWHSTGPQAHEGHDEAQCPGATCPVVVMRAEVEKKAQAQAAQEARYARYDAWRTIPVYNKIGRGYYAVAEADGTVKFFRVDRPSQGKYAGRTFIKVQASDEFHQMPWGVGADYLDKIAADPETAATLYGQEIGQCYRCNRTLTDAVSRARGIGPDCVNKV